ncbi:hypothetical protein AAFF_G00203470 [Aldrovandia affinis]|uniref:Uncharacterized protein n=1 Tax=Aldrovandia affinis TaxID=143900 RepID=A0AAD7WUU6_9TELE|nr:hypothetical protein AAFF_G00203470 [Aldrovandia affinis]
MGICRRDVAVHGNAALWLVEVLCATGTSSSAFCRLRTERACALAHQHCIGVASESLARLEVPWKKRRATTAPAGIFRERLRKKSMERSDCLSVDPFQFGVVTHILQAEEVVSVSGDNPPNTDAVPALGPLTELPLFPAHSA